ncbi:hypothetical protein ACJX0J_001785, partial [Zea mays]
LIKISYKYRFSLEFNQSITKQESSFILTKRNTKMIRKKIHNSVFFIFLIFFFNTSMLGLVTSSNLIQIYFFGNLGFWSFRDLFKIANNWIPNNGINSLLTTFFISLIGTITLFLGATLALAQRDIKRSLAYSTMSQLGYMMLALGIGSYQAALFHLITHAYSKALLFLGSGSIKCQNMFLWVLVKVRCIQYPYGEKGFCTPFGAKILLSILMKREILCYFLFLYYYFLLCFIGSIGIHFDNGLTILSKIQKRAFWMKFFLY